MWFDLGCVGVPFNTQFTDKFLGVVLPVDIRVGRQMGIVVTNGAVDFAEHRTVRELLQLSLQPVHHIGQLFANSGRGSSLAVGARQHRLSCRVVSQLAQTIDKLLHRRQHDQITTVTQHQSVRQVVDIF